MKNNVILALGLCAAATSVSAQAITCDETYRVGRGDTLGGISERAYGVGKLGAFYQANKSVIGENPNRITVGMRLSVPCSIGSAPVVAAAPEATSPAGQADFSAATISLEPDPAAAPKGPRWYSRSTKHRRLTSS